MAVGSTNEGQMSLTGSKTFTYKWKQIYTYTLIYMDHLYELLIYYWGWMTKWMYCQINLGIGLVWYFPIVLACLLEKAYNWRKSFLSSNTKWYLIYALQRLNRILVLAGNQELWETLTESELEEGKLRWVS